MKLTNHSLGAFPQGATKPILFSADWQLGSINCDEDRIRKDIAEAKRRGADVFLVGDIFDGIFPNDRRFRLSGVPSFLRGTDDHAGAVIQRAYELLQPVARSVRLVGMGNHEEHVLERHSVDLARGLAERLPGAVPGEYTGYYTYRATGVQPFVIHYDHGAGGDNQSRGLINATRKAMHHDFDLYVTGHLHNRWCCDDVKIEKGKVRSRKMIMVGSYLNPLNTKECGSSYDERWGLAPKPQGGVFVTLRREGNKLIPTVEL